MKNRLYDSFGDDNLSTCDYKHSFIFITDLELYGIDIYVHKHEYSKKKISHHIHKNKMQKKRIKNFPRHRLYFAALIWRNVLIRPIVLKGYSMS